MLNNTRVFFLDVASGQEVGRCGRPAGRQDDGAQFLRLARRAQRKRVPVGQGEKAGRVLFVLGFHVLPVVSVGQPVSLLVVVVEEAASATRAVHGFLGLGRAPVRLCPGSGRLFRSIRRDLGHGVFLRPAAESLGPPVAALTSCRSEGLGHGLLRRNRQRVALSSRELPEFGPGAAGVGLSLVRAHAASRRVQVEHEREHRLAGHVKEFNLTALEVLASVERVDLGDSARSGVVVRVLDVDLAARFAGKDIRLAAREPDVAPRTRRLGRDLIVLQTQRVQSLYSLELVA